MHGRVEKVFLEIRLTTGEKRNINHTVPGSLIKPHSSLYQSNNPIFLTEEKRGILSDQRILSCRFLLNPQCCFFSSNIELDTVSFFPQLEVNPRKVLQQRKLSGCKVFCVFTLLFSVTSQLSSLPSHIKSGNIPSADKDGILRVSPTLNVRRQKPLILRITAATKLSRLRSCIAQKQKRRFK